MGEDGKVRVGPAKGWREDKISPRAVSKLLNSAQERDGDYQGQGAKCRDSQRHAGTEVKEREPSGSGFLLCTHSGCQQQFRECRGRWASGREYVWKVMLI